MICLGLLLFAKASALAQDKSSYDFIQYDKNHLVFEGNSYKYFEAFFRKLNDLITKGDKQLHILHIGDSHVQADIFPGEMRKRLKAFEKGIEGSRGFIFPYSLAKTNNPPDYKVSSTANWERCRNVTRSSVCELGIAGINISTSDSSFNIKIQFIGSGGHNSSFNRIRIYHNIRDVGYDFMVKNYQGSFKKRINLSEAYTEIIMDEYLSSVELFAYRCDSEREALVLHGVFLGNDDPGIIYSSLGVNGAEAASFLRCSLLEEQLRSLNPDVLIISLGTNEAYARDFKPDRFFTSYDSLLRIVRKSLPEAAIIITTPGDSYRNRRYSNPDNIKAVDVLFLLAFEHNAAIWDFYTVMGGLNAILKWQQKGLSNADRLHLNRNGYLLQGELFYDAFFKSYDDFLDANMKANGLD